MEKVPEWSLLIVYHCLTRLNPLQRCVLPVLPYLSDKVKQLCVLLYYYTFINIS